MGDADYRSKVEALSPVASEPDPTAGPPLPTTFDPHRGGSRAENPSAWNPVIIPARPAPVAADPDISSSRRDGPGLNTQTGRCSGDYDSAAVGAYRRRVYRDTSSEDKRRQGYQTAALFQRLRSVNYAQNCCFHGALWVVSLTQSFRHDYKFEMACSDADNGLAAYLLFTRPITPHAIRPPASPLGCDFRSSAFSCTITERPMIDFAPSCSDRV